MRKRPGLCPEHRSPFLSSLNKVSTCKTNGTLVSIQFCKYDNFYAFFCFSLSLRRYHKRAVPTVKAATVFMVPGREKHQSLLIRTQCNINHRQLDKASSCQQRSISTMSPVNCTHRIHSCHRKYSLAQFTFLTQRHHPHSKLDL